jgi:hypothetical protein
MAQRTSSDRLLPSNAGKRRTLSAVRARLVEYYENPRKYMDEKNFTVEYGEIRFPIKPVEEVIGLKKLGSGCYSDVYEINATTVLKVVKHEDSGYARFVKMCQEMKGNRYLPRILYSGKWGQKTVYVLERLNEYKNRDDRDDYSDRQPGVIWVDYYEHARRNKMNEQFRKALKSRDADNPFMGIIDPELRAVAKALRDRDLLGDLHGGNVMWRGETLVVTDPSCY